MEIKRVFISVHTEKMVGLLYIPKAVSHKLPSIVVFHGRGSSKMRFIDRARALCEKGFLTLVFDFRGCGESEGDFRKQTVAMGFADAVAAYTFLTSKKFCDVGRIGIFGNSFGGYLAALLSAKFQIASLALSAPAILKDSWWDTIPETIDLLGRKLFREQSDFEKTKVIKAIKKFSGKLLVIEHGNDELIPKNMTRIFYQSALNASLRKTVVIPDAPHALHDKIYLDQSEKIITDWFTRTL